MIPNACDGVEKGLGVVGKIMHWLGFLTLFRFASNYQFGIDSISRIMKYLVLSSLL